MVSYILSTNLCYKHEIPMGLDTPAGAQFYHIPLLIKTTREDSCGSGGKS